uniref:Uncharacterized protein n=1 Tax=Castor canadensis TaxID=51338 RepID=A0A8C0WQH1_CASCN
MSNYSVSLVGPAPWGSWLQGGKDFSMPLTISSLKDRHKACQANVRIGNMVFSIDGINEQGMTYLVQVKFKSCAGSLNMTLQRASATSKPEPFGSSSSPKVTSIPSSSSTAQEIAEGQRRGSQGDGKQQNGRPRKHIVEHNKEFYYIPTNSDDWNKSVSSFRVLAQITGTEHLKESETDNTKKAKEKIPLHYFSPKYTKLRDWHHEISAHAVKFQSLIVT